MSTVTEAKAVWLALHDKVTVTGYHLDPEGWIDVAAGHVESGTNTYWVTLDPAGGTCTCNEYQSGRTHSHTLALRLAAQQEARNG